MAPRVEHQRRLGGRRYVVASLGEVEGRRGGEEVTPLPKLQRMTARSCSSRQRRPKTRNEPWRDPCHARIGISGRRYVASREQRAGMTPNEVGKYFFVFRMLKPIYYCIFAVFNRNGCHPTSVHDPRIERVFSGRRYVVSKPGEPMAMWKGF